MTTDFSEQTDETAPPIRVLTKPQRRVLGVLLEKGFTTPESYPLTLKSLTTGCNQKSNRSPLANYDESEVYDIADQLREMGLLAVVHTETGRTERYRHYARKKFPFSEAQLAILTELMLRGRQTLGELRARASRMVPIDSLNDLRAELKNLMDQGYLQATAALERRGAEVDHTLYEPREGKELAVQNSSEPGEVFVSETAPDVSSEVASGENTTQPLPAVSSGELESFRAELDALKEQNRQLKDELEGVQTEFQELTQQVDEIRRDLGI